MTRRNVSAAKPTTDQTYRLVTLVERLAAEFEPAIGLRGVLEAVRDAREAVALVGADGADGRLELVERVARASLESHCGAPQTARLMPYAHSRRASAAPPPAP